MTWSRRRSTATATARMQKTGIIFLILSYAHAVKPPGYVEPPKTEDPNPPKYSYGYKIGDHSGGQQGKEEKRDGIYAAGRYYIDQKGASQDVRYFADDWGYHPVVEYSNAGPHSRANTKFALGHEAVQQLRNKENHQPQLQGLPETGNLKIDGPERPQIQVYTDDNGIHRNGSPGDSNLISPASSSDPGNAFTGDSQQLHQPQPGAIVFNQRASTSGSEQLTQNLDQPQQEIQPKQPQVEEKQILVQPASTQETIQPNLIQIQNPQGGGDESKQILVEYKQPLQKIIFPQPTTQFLQVGEPSHVNEPRQNLVIQHEVVHTTPQLQTNALYERGSENLIQPQPLVQYLGENSLQDSNLEQFQTFGLKIKDKESKKSNNLIESTKHLVTGEDVLNINEAVTATNDIRIESTTANSVTNLASNEGFSTAFEDDTSYFTTTAPSFTVTESRLDVKPIVVADGNFPSTTYEVREQDVSSTTAKSIESISTSLGSSSASTVIVTPRPVSTKFLAPITAGVRLGGHDYKLTEKSSQSVEIQKTIPYYFGKYEFPLQYAQQYGKNMSGVMQDIELGKTILMLPQFQVPETQKLTQQRLPDIRVNKLFKQLDDKLTAQQLPLLKIQDNFLESDQQQAQGIQHQVQLQQFPKNSIKQDYFVNQHAQPVRIAYDITYPVVKQVEVPVKYEKIVEKPVHITRYIEKPVPVPQPYPVEKIVEKPIHVPVQVTKYIDRPYPVEVRVPIPQPYPVEKIVQKIVKQPYPVEVRVPFQVEKIVEKKVPVPHYIEKPITVEKIVEKPVPHYVDRPYPVEVKVPVPQPFYVEVPRPVHVQSRHYHPLPAQQQNVFPLRTTVIQVPLYNTNEQYAQQSQQLSYVFPNPYAYAPQINQYLPPNQHAGLQYAYVHQPQANNGYLPPHSTHDCNPLSGNVNIRNQHAKLEADHSLLPPKPSGVKYTRSFRSARSKFDDSSIRMEYGFKPPMIPSPEIDEQGRPIEKSD